MERLRELRGVFGISQAQMAKELQISQASISKYETGLAQPDFKMVVTIAKYFCVTTDYLLNRTDESLLNHQNDLSNIERNLLYSFRKLNAYQQEKVLIYIRGLMQL